ncbi:uncharacterized protein [Triticum aestivum]|uniref:uncharacterized protein n=1 Tax=Triticum aestivum TaxID=4565 RepID=UPI001D018078|nr:uncharacterized protein LOC123091949 [Triticum aestivum]
MTPHLPLAGNGGSTRRQRALPPPPHLNVVVVAFLVHRRDSWWATSSPWFSSNCTSLQYKPARKKCSSSLKHCWVLTVRISFTVRFWLSWVVGMTLEGSELNAKYYDSKMV